MSSLLSGRTAALGVDDGLPAGQRLRIHDEAFPRRRDERLDVAVRHSDAHQPGQARAGQDGAVGAPADAVNARAAARKID